MLVKSYLILLWKRQRHSRRRAELKCACLQHAGQVYIPFMNYLLMALCLIITGAFQTSDNIGKAYGE